MAVTKVNLLFRVMANNRTILFMQGVDDYLPVLQESPTTYSRKKGDEIDPQSMIAIRENDRVKVSSD